MSNVAVLQELPAFRHRAGTRRRRARSQSAPQIVVELATSSDIESGMEGALPLLRRVTGAVRVEWWAPSQGSDQLALHSSDGAGIGPSASFALGPAGSLVFSGGDDDLIRRTVEEVAPVIRRRFAEEWLAQETARLARRNRALEDFAALVAHELKSPLEAALLAQDGSDGIIRALDLVDALLETARTEPHTGVADPAACLASALADLGDIRAQVEADLPEELPVAPTALHVLLRNLIGNAVSAGARHIRVAGAPCLPSWCLVVEDDGVGLSSTDGYASGSGLGFELSRRLVERMGGTLELTPASTGGARATLAVGVAA
jgi:signal transduction histidine kinase